MNDHIDYLSLKNKNMDTTQCALFDFDGTLVVKKNGDNPEYSENSSSNYVFLYGVEDYINNLIEDNILPVIVSNQSNFTLYKGKMFKKIYKHFNKKILILVAHLNNQYRKPCTGFSDMLKEKYDILFHCGDAVGKSSFPPYNFSSVDKKFARNSDIEFIKPLKLFGSNFKTIIPKEEVIIMMGLPGSGKSTIARRLEKEHDYIRFSQDNNLNLQLNKNLKAISEKIEEGHKVVLDATHRKHSLRKPFIKLAKEHGVKYRILWCVRDGRPFNELRCEEDEDEHHSKPVIHFPFSLYVKEFEEPKKHFTIVS